MTKKEMQEIIELLNNDNKMNRKNLEWLVLFALTTKETPIISISRGKELLNFEYMDDMREFMNRHHLKGKLIESR